MKLGIHLAFNGNCEEAFKFYQKCFTSKIDVMMTWGATPMAKDMPKGWEKKITHASMTVSGVQIAGGDSPDNWFQKPQGTYVVINTEEAKEAERIFKALADNGEIKMPLEETFWAVRFGMCIDRFGTPWMINCGKPH